MVTLRLPCDIPKVVVTLKGYSHTKCMHCDNPPELDIMWANSKGRAWMCADCFIPWTKEFERGWLDMNRVYMVKDGQVPKEWGDNSKAGLPTIKTKSPADVMKWLGTLKGGPGSGWYAPPKGTHTGEEHTKVGSGTSGDPAGKGAVDLKSRIKNDLVEDALIAMENDGRLNKDRVATALDITRRAVADGDIAIRVDQNTVWRIIDSGRFLTSQEVGQMKGEGTVPTQWDAEFFQEAKAAEDAAFNLDGVPISQHPIYGVVDGTKTTGANLALFGNVKVMLRPEVRDRSTMTVGDSRRHFLEGVTAPSPLNDIGAESVGAQAYNLYKNGTQYIDYFEVQIHGGVALSDISKVIVGDIRQGRSKVAGALTADVESALRNAGIDVEYPGKILK